MGATRLEGGCEVIEKQEISELARELSLDLHVVEKDYVLGWLLAGIAANPELSENWVFKGGTCLKKCYFETYRFSEDLDGTPAKGKKRSRTRNAPRFNLRELMFKMCGVDLTRIDGIDVSTALTVISEVGPDMSRFPTVKHFACWLGLCPGTRITGGKVMSSKTKRVANRAAQALRLAAAALRTSQSALGAYFRRLCSRMDKPKAVTAAAHKLARLIYTMLTKGEEYTDQGQDYYEERYRERVLGQLAKRAEKMGMKLVTNENPAEYAV